MLLKIKIIVILLSVSFCLTHIKSDDRPRDGLLKKGFPFSYYVDGSGENLNEKPHIFYNFLLLNILVGFMIPFGAFSILSGVVLVVKGKIAKEVES